MNSKSDGKLNLSLVGPTAQTLRDIYGYTSLYSLFAERATQLRWETGVQGPPFDPFEYADRLGITVEERDDMGLDGMLECDAAGRFVIRLRKDVSKERKNFTLAHEIAHTFFYDVLTHPKSYRGHHDFDPEEEHLCDIGASELLMPSSAFKQDLFCEEEITPVTLFRLAKLYQVSLKAVAVKVLGVTNNLACVAWKKKEAAIDVEWVCPSRIKRLTLCQTGKSSVEMAFRNPRTVFTKSDSFYGAKERGRVVRSVSSLGLNKNKAISIITMKTNGGR
jgi:hypothetical protein